MSDSATLIEEYATALHAGLLAGKTWPVENRLEQFQEDDDVDAGVRQAVFAGLLASIQDNLSKGLYADAPDAPRIIAWLQGKVG